MKYYGLAKACNQIRGEDSARDEILLLSNTNPHASQKLPKWRRYEALGGEFVEASFMDQQMCAIGSEKKTW